MVLQALFSAGIFAFISQARALAPFNGAATVGSCSASVVQLEGMSEKARALVLTNGHCIPAKSAQHVHAYLQPGEFLFNREMGRDLAPIDVRIYDGLRSGEPVEASRVVFATMTGTDVAIIELKDSYAELRERYALEAFALSKVPTPQGSLSVYAGLFGRIQTCSITDRVDLKEGDYQTRAALKFDEGCSFYPGFSGAPVIAKDGRTVVGLANTHFDGASPRDACSLNKPCELNATEVPRDGQSYGIQTDWIYTCFDPQRGVLDFSKSGCEYGLKASWAKKVIRKIESADRKWSYGGRQILAGDPLNRTLVAIGNKKSAVCSGTFVAKDVVLTAAHCVIPDEDGNAVGKVGDFVYPLNLDAGYDPIRGEKIRIIKVVVHPQKKENDFWMPVGDNQFPFDNPDLALLKLERSYDDAQPAAIATQSVSRKARNAAFAGFGQGTTNWQRPDRISYSIARDAAAELRLQYRGVESGNSLDFIEAMIADISRLDPIFFVVRAEKPGEQTLCFGDSGGPLFIENDGRIEILGVASLYIPHPTRGNRACNDSFLNLFAKIDPYRKWLVGEIEKLKAE